VAWSRGQQCFYYYKKHTSPCVQYAIRAGQELGWAVQDYTKQDIYLPQLGYTTAVQQAAPRQDPSDSEASDSDSDSGDGDDDDAPLGEIARRRIARKQQQKQEPSSTSGSAAPAVRVSPGMD
jgi:hypothetical protein